MTLQVPSKETENARVGKLDNGTENAYNHGMSILVMIFVKHIVTTQSTRGLMLPRMKFGSAYSNMHALPNHCSLEGNMVGIL